MTGKNNCFDIFRSFSTDRGFEFAEGEPSSKLGKKKGLVILLDAHYTKISYTKLLSFPSIQYTTYIALI